MESVLRRPNRQVRRCRRRRRRELLKGQILLSGEVAPEAAEGVSSREVPTPVSAAASVGSRQSATGARSPPSRCYSLHGRRPCRNGGGILFFFSQGGRGPPWESPFSRGKASLYKGAALRWRAFCDGLRFRDRRSWTVPTGHQDPSRQVRRCRLQAAEGVFRGRERAGKSKKSPSLWGRGKSGGVFSPGGAGGPCRARR